MKVLLVVGMASAGKTTFLHHAISKKKSSSSVYVVNIDPAAAELPFECNINIKDVINYKKVMKEYQLGPNGAILTSLNMFATKIDQITAILHTRKDLVDYTFIDTPGQIEVFTWSASGEIITNSLKDFFPVTMIYIIDTVKCQSPKTFISNMLYALSIYYKTKLPMVLVFNKIDLLVENFIELWMNDYTLFCDAVQNEGDSYMNSLLKAMYNSMESLFKTIPVVYVSSVTGEGIDDILKKCSN